VFTEPILHVDMDAFFVEVERLRNPALAGRPVVVGGAGRRGVVASASYEARRFGVRSAMPTGRARQLCPGLVVLPSDHGEYHRVSEQVFEIFRGFTPLVEGGSLDEAYLDVAGLRLHYDDPVQIAHAVRSEIRRRLHLPASVGIAATKLVAKLASEAAKPDGVRHVPAPATLGFLHPLPVRALAGVGEATHAALEGMGVTTVGDLAGIPVALLEKRLGGASGRHLAALAQGLDPRPVVPDSAAKSISVSETYEVDLVTAFEIDTELVRLADRLASRLRRAGLAAHTIGLKVRFGDFTTVTRNITVKAPIDERLQLQRLAREMAAKLAIAEPVRLLGVEAKSLTMAVAPRQLEVGHSPKAEDLADAVDAVRSKYGGAAVMPARLSKPTPGPGSD
jgi:DNA polymerase-4